MGIPRHSCPSLSCAKHSLPQPMSNPEKMSWADCQAYVSSAQGVLSLKSVQTRLDLVEELLLCPLQVSVADATAAMLHAIQFGGSKARRCKARGV